MKTDLKKILIVYKKWDHPSSKSKETHHQTINQIQKELRKRNISFSQVLRDRLKITHQKEVENEFKKYDMILTLGGDGTFLHASHFIFSNLPLIGINSAPETSYGGLCCSDGKTFGVLLDSIIDKKGDWIKLQRLQVILEGNKIPVLALNDVLFSNATPAGTSRYTLQIGNRKEFQKSSGIWIAPAAGSTGAIFSSGGNLLPIESKKWQYRIREPFPHQGSFQLQSANLEPKQKIKIISNMTKGAIFIDGAHLRYPLQQNSKIEILTAKELLYTLKVHASK